MHTPIGHSVHNLLTTSVHNLMTLTVHEVLTLYTLEPSILQWDIPVCSAVPWVLLHIRIANLLNPEISLEKTSRTKFSTKRNRTLASAAKRQAEQCLLFLLARPLSLLSPAQVNLHSL